MGMSSIDVEYIRERVHCAICLHNIGGEAQLERACTLTLLVLMYFDIDIEDDNGNELCIVDVDTVEKAWRVIVEKLNLDDKGDIQTLTTSFY